jgi:hypothetical protein
VNRKGKGSASSGTFSTLLIVKGPPLRSLICKFGSDDETTTHANYLGALVVSHEAIASTFGAFPDHSRLWEVVFFHFFFLFFLPALEGIT